MVVSSCSVLGLSVLWMKCRAEIDRQVAESHVCNSSLEEKYTEILAIIRPRDPAAVMHWIQWNVIQKFKMH